MKLVRALFAVSSMVVVSAACDAGSQHEATTATGVIGVEAEMEEAANVSHCAGQYFHSSFGDTAGDRYAHFWSGAESRWLQTDCADLTPPKRCGTVGNGVFGCVLDP